MRSASSYRANRKKAAREIGIPLARYNKAFDIAARQAENPQWHEPGGPQAAARERLAIWARNGGRFPAILPAATADDLKAMNESVQSEEIERATEAAKKLTTADVDKAMEKALTNWQAARNEGPLVLSRVFAARARTLGWVENVEFVEER